MHRLALVAAGATLLQTAFGAFTRGSGSGYGCRDRWPLCEGGVLSVGNAGGLLPRFDAPMIVEWTHRWIALVLALVVLAVTVTAWRHRHAQPVLAVLGVVAATVIVGQALLGAAVVRDFGNADLVTWHLAGAMTLLAVLVHLAVRTREGTDARRGRDLGWTRACGLGVLLVLATILLGSLVHDLYVGGWPLAGGRLLPSPDLGWRVNLHIVHRLAAGVGAVLLWWLARQAVRRSRPAAEVLLVRVGLWGFLANVALGGIHVLTRVTSAAVVAAHLGIAATAFAALVAAWSRSLTGAREVAGAVRAPTGPVTGATENPI